MTRVNRATFVGSISIVLWGALALFTRLTGGEIPAFQLMAMTFAVAFLLMSLRWIGQGHFGVRHLKQPWPAWLIGVGGYFGYHFCYFMAMSKAPAVEASLLAYLWPLFIVLFAAMLPGESLRGRHLLGAVMAFTGCWVLLGQGGAEFSQEYLMGYSLAFSCALIWSIYSVASRLVKTVPTDAVAWFCAATAVLALVCHLLLETTVWPQDSIQWIGVLGLGVGPVGIAFFTWDYGIKHGDIQLLGVLAYLAPLISVLLLILAGEAEPSWALTVACAVIVTGSAIAGISKRTRRVSMIRLRRNVWCSGFQD